MAACGSTDDESAADTVAESAAGTADTRGAELARVHGCTSCHGAEGQGGFGPPWRGLAGSEVELADGRSVVADQEYVRRAITDPQAEQRAGYSIPMPATSLSPDEVDALVAHIETFR